MILQRETEVSRLSTTEYRASERCTAISKREQHGLSVSGLHNRLRQCRPAHRLRPGGRQAALVAHIQLVRTHMSAPVLEGACDSRKGES